MASVLNPTPATTLKYQKVKAASDGVTVTQAYFVPSVNVATFEAAYTLGLAHDVYTASRLNSIDKDPIDGDGGSTVMYLYTLTYANPEAKSKGGGASPPPSGTTQKRGSANATDIPIERNLNYEIAWKNSKLGVENYIAPQPTYTLTEFFTAEEFTLTESALIDDVGKRPTAATMISVGVLGVTNATNWLMVDKTIQVNGSSVEITRTWQYAANGWDTEIYAAGA